MNRQHQFANGRFMQPDPIGGSIGIPQSLNRYAYVVGDPVNLSDPLGLDWTNDASIRGPGVQLDRFEMPQEMWGMIYNLWAMGAADIETGFSQIPEWMRKEYGIQDPNDYLRLLPVGYSECDKKLAGIFGAEGAVAAGSGYEPPAVARANGFTVGGLREHLLDRLHVYAKPDGSLPSSSVGLYVPSGGGKPFSREAQAPGDASYGISYKQLGKLTNVTLIVSHVGNFNLSPQDKNAAGSIRIGNIGGPGGDGAKYFHSHLAILDRKGKRHSFAEAFCN